MAEGESLRLEKLSALAELVSSLAIVITLAYLAIQTHQNSVAIQASVRQAMLTDDRELLFQSMSHAPALTAMIRGDDLTDEQLYEITAYLVASVRVRENQWLQYQNGVIDERTWLTYRTPIGILFSNEFTRAWWRDRSGTGEFDAEFVEMVDDLLDRTPVRGNRVDIRLE